MVKHYIEPIFNPHLSCYQLLLATYAASQRRSSDMICADSWGFVYNKKNKIFGEGLHPGYQNRQPFLFEKFHGIQIDCQIYFQMEELVGIIQNYLPLTPIMLFCDVFHCPWNMSYQKYKISHYVLIIGNSENTREVYVLDPYSASNINKIKIDFIAPNKGHLFTFKMLQPVHPQINDYYLEMENSLNYVANSSFFCDLESFYFDLHNRFKEVIESTTSDIYAVPLILHLNQIANQRYCYCTFLEILCKKGIIDINLFNSMQFVAEEYALLRKNLIKQIIKKKINYDQINKFYSIIESEHRTYDMMKAYV